MGAMQIAICNVNCHFCSSIWFYDFRIPTSVPHACILIPFLSPQPKRKSMELVLVFCVVSIVTNGYIWYLSAFCTMYPHSTLYMRSIIYNALLEKNVLFVVWLSTGVTWINTSHRMSQNASSSWMEMETMHTHTYIYMFQLCSILSSI